MDKQTADKVQEFLNRYPVELDWDYDSQLSETQIAHLLSGPDGRFAAEEEIYEHSHDWIWELECDAFKYALEELDLLPEDVCDCVIRDMRNELIDEHGVGATIDLGLERLARQTRAYFAAPLPIEHCSYWNEYWEVKDEMEWFGINPADMREWFPNVRMYDCPTRKDPMITPEALADAWVNFGYTGYWYVMLDAESVLTLALRGELDGTLTVSKGAGIILHDYLNGASSIDVYTLKPFEIEAKSIFDDGSDGYGIQSTCGLHDDAWCGVVSRSEG